MGSIQQELQSARKAKLAIGKLNANDKLNILNKIADSLIFHTIDIIRENQKDLDCMDPKDAKYDRLMLTEERVSALAGSVRSVAHLEDPTGKILLSKRLKNGLFIEKRSVALGVVGVIYESRPNVTIDVAALCVQSGNVCLLRGGSDAWNTNSFLIGLIHRVLSLNGIDPHIVQLLPMDRSLVMELLTARGFVDILIPRGSQGLIDFVRENAKVPVIETGAGVCHTFVDASADLDKAVRIVANAKISRPSVCNALDTVLLEAPIVHDFLNKIKSDFVEHQVEIYADEQAYKVLDDLEYPYRRQASRSDFGREFLSLQCSIKTVQSLEEALEHIATYSSKHSECIVSNNADHIATFMNTVDAAAVYANASTRFTDGGEFGLGAEIGISTQKLHARGPFALEKLVTEKWFVTGDGQVR